jgi:AcrR family transcriptional regulator
VAATELSADTRARILEAAWQRVRDHGTSAVSVKDIAAAAGVSRQLVYFHFGNRAGLLTAMARHQDRRSGFADQVAATRALPPQHALETLLGAWCAYLPDLLPVARALEAALITGDEGGSAWRDRMNDLWKVLRHTIERLADCDLLADDWTIDAATDWAWARIQPSTYAHLVGERGWTHDDYAERTTRTLLAELLTSVATNTLHPRPAA